MFTKCEICGKKYYIRPSHFARVKHHFCSRKCRGIFHRGKGNPMWKDEYKICKTCGKKFKAKYKEQKFCCRKCMGISYRGKKHNWYTPSGSDHYGWKDKPAYKSLHTWINRHFGKPDVCEMCGKSGLSGSKIHWANKSGEYRRDRDDWLRLCSFCHKKYDKENKDNFSKKDKGYR